MKLVKFTGPEIIYESGGIRRSAIAVWEAGHLHLSSGDASFIFSEGGDAEADESRSDGNRIIAPIAGLAVQVFAKPGQTIAADQTLAVIEAMKMETRVRAVFAGRVSAVHVEQGSQVANASLLFEIERPDEGADV